MAEARELTPTGRGYPIGTLFVLVTICAVLTAAVTPSIRGVMNGGLKWWEPLAAAGSGLALLSVVGAVVGILYYLHWHGLLIGSLAGGAVGLVAGPLVLVKQQDLPTMGAAMFVGSLVAVVLAAIMRKRDDEARPEDQP